MIKVRFNLGRGENYLKWQVMFPDGEVEYYEPDEYQLNLYVCTLRNQKGTATKIFEGANKTVCAWIDCEAIDVRSKNPINYDLDVSKLHKVSYNPRVKPNWDFKGNNMDSEKLDYIVSSNRGLFSQ